MTFAQKVKEKLGQFFPASHYVYVNLFGSLDNIRGHYCKKHIVDVAKCHGPLCPLVIKEYEGDEQCKKCLGNGDSFV